MTEDDFTVLQSEIAQLRRRAEDAEGRAAVLLAELDAGGSAAAMTELNAARDEALKERA